MSKLQVPVEIFIFLLMEDMFTHPAPSSYQRLRFQDMSVRTKPKN